MSECHKTHITGVGSFATVNKFVSSQSIPTRKRFITNVTSEPFDAIVDTFVSAKCADITKRHKTHITGVGFFSTVNTFVSGQMIHAGICLITNVTHEPFHAIVDDFFVTVKSRVITICLITHITFV